MAAKLDPLGLVGSLAGAFTLPNDPLVDMVIGSDFDTPISAASPARSAVGPTSDRSSGKRAIRSTGCCCICRW
ncbi:MAG: hypothetical protein U0559_04945 [Anaerolineae bacterium]